MTQKASKFVPEDVHWAVNKGNKTQLEHPNMLNALLGQSSCTGQSDAHDTSENCQNKAAPKLRQCRTFVCFNDVHFSHEEGLFPAK